MKLKNLFFAFATTMALLISGCKNKRNVEEKCTLEGKWKAVSFTANREVDTNNDGKAHSNLKLEDSCMNVEYTFNSNGYVKRRGKNSKSNCKYNDLNFLYTVSDSIISFESQGRTTSIRYEIKGCTLTFFDIDGLDRTEDGFKSFKINSIYEKVNMP